MNMQIERTRPAHLGDLRQAVQEAGLFPVHMLDGLLSPALAGAEDVCALSWLTDGRAMGLFYAQSETLTDRCWTLLLILIRPCLQRAGYGTGLLAKGESCLRTRHARLLVLETFGSAQFAPQRAFYRKNGYQAEARIRDFWAEGVDKVVYRKRL